MTDETDREAGDRAEDCREESQDGGAYLKGGVGDEAYWNLNRRQRDEYRRPYSYRDHLADN